MAAINEVTLLGRLTKDPEVRKTTSGISHCRFTIACDRRKTKEDQEPGADFISCIAWRQNADYISNYGTKGALVAVQGAIQTGSYTDREGRKIFTTDVLAGRVQLVESKRPRADYPSNGTSYTMTDASRDANAGFNAGDGDAEINPDDDLPF